MAQGHEIIKKIVNEQQKKQKNIVQQMGRIAHAHISYIFHDPIVNVVWCEIVYWILGAEIDFGFAFKIFAPC